MYIRIFSLICAIFLLCTSNNSFGKHESSSPKLQELTASIKTIVSNTPQPFSGSVILQKRGVPVLELSVGEGINKDSKFVIASLSKQITTTLVLQAVDTGKIELNRSLNSYLYDDTASHRNRYDDSITIHHLLTHTSGIQPIGKPSLFKAGSQFKYSNFGYSLLGKVLEKVNQRPFEKQIKQFSKDNQLPDLHADVGTINTIQQKLPLLAMGYNETDKLTPSNLNIRKPMLPSGGIIASAKTFASFQNQLHSGKLLSHKSYQLMTSPHTNIKFFWPNMHYGYGLRVNKDNGLTEFSHTGYVSGYMSMSLHYPQFDLDLVMLENIALRLDDIDRVFQLHNQIRKSIREHLRTTEQ
ncbi:serine hydrolase domain-containing protein [Parashewanella tropica]|uniref:serine hydrolase domain-containing protein n=1 Tax=Parashewanella tropica TaxID=2547970 RepID=UPI00105A05D6|nr:serine hydrolase domain-containing protein [Parashewanella tropica]